MVIITKRNRYAQSNDELGVNFVVEATICVRTHANIFLEVFLVKLIVLLSNGSFVDRLCTWSELQMKINYDSMCAHTNYFVKRDSFW